MPLLTEWMWLLVIYFLVRVYFRITPIQKILANRAFHLIANFLFRKPFRDISNNLKLMKREMAKRLQLESGGFLQCRNWTIANFHGI